MDSNELEKQIERLHPGAFGWARACCDGDIEEAEDVLQTVYLKILDGRAVFEGRSSLKTWVFGVIRKTAVERRRLRLARRLRLLHWRNGHAPSALSRTPEAVIDERQSGRALQEALERLSKRQRQLLHLVFYQELTVEEASGVLGISPGAGRVHYQRGKERLRRILSTEDRP